WRGHAHASHHPHLVGRHRIPTQYQTATSSAVRSDAQFRAGTVFGSDAIERCRRPAGEHAGGIQTRVCDGQRPEVSVGGGRQPELVGDFDELSLAGPSREVGELVTELGKCERGVWRDGTWAVHTRDDDDDKHACPVSSTRAHASLWTRPELWRSARTPSVCHCPPPASAHCPPHAARGPPAARRLALPVWSKPPAQPRDARTNTQRNPRRRGSGSAQRAAQAVDGGGVLG